MNLKFATLLFGVGLTLLVIGVSSCNKQNSLVTQGSTSSITSTKKTRDAGNNLETVWQNLNSLTTEGDKKLAYATLSLEEARYCWKRHVETKSQSMTLNSQQLAAINNLILLTNEMVEVTEANESYVNSIEANWYALAQPYFTENEMYSLAYTLDNNTNNPPAPIVNQNPGSGGSGGSGGGGGMDCKCYTGSTFLSCGLFYCRTKLKCNKLSKGCGWMWGKTCDGLCMNE